MLFVACTPLHHAARKVATRTTRTRAAKPAPAFAVRAKRGKRSLVIDLHCHLLTPAVEELVKEVYEPQQDPLYRFASDATRAVNRKQGADIRERMSVVEPRLQATVEVVFWDQVLQRKVVR